MAEASQPGRLIGPDVCWGFTVLAMALLHTPGEWGRSYPPPEHAA